MSIKVQLENSLKDAMREKDELRKRTIRLALSSIKNAEIDKGAPIDEPTMIAILHKEIKNRQETIVDAQKGNRQDLVEQAEAEIKIIRLFLPQSLSEDEIVAIVKAAIEETGSSQPSDMGKVMKVVMPRVQGKASGNEISAVASKILNPPAK